MELNERIKRLRISKSLTQKELGELVCVSETSIKCWESGAKKPSLQKIILLCKAFGVSTDCLLGVSINYSTENSMYNLLLTTSEKVMLNNYRSLDKHGKCVVETVCELEKKRIIDSSHSDDNVPLIKKMNQTRIIPKYLTPIAAGYSVPIDEDEAEMIRIDSSAYPDADFAVEISGNSMFPYIEDGDIKYKIWDVDIIEGDIDLSDAKVFLKDIYIVNDSMYAKCLDGFLRINELQKSGKNRMKVKDFINGLMH